jgi:DHA2 family multidrug resistance protein-like MFS transporter
MNDATRELGAALGVAVLGSIAATHYAHAVGGAANTALQGGAAKAATRSLSDALDAAHGLAPAANSALTDAAKQAFLGGVHIAVLIAAALAAGTSVVVMRYLPRTLRHEHAGPDHAIETTEADDRALAFPAELGVAEIG